MNILVYVRTTDGKKYRVSKREWDEGTDPLTVYNNRGIPVYTTHPEHRWSGMIYLPRDQVKGLLVKS